MRWLKVIDRQTYLVILAPLVIALLASLVALMVTRSSEWFVFIATTFFILVLFGFVISFQAGRLSQRVVDILDRRLPEIKIIEGDYAALEHEIMQTVRGAKSYIAATGGKTRVKSYLESIEQKVLNGEARYTRVIQGNPRVNTKMAIRHELCQHLQKLLNNAVAARLTTVICVEPPDIGYYLVTDAGFIIFKPNPRPKAPFDSCVSLPGRPQESDRMREYIAEVLGGLPGALRATTPEQVRELCRECQGQVKTGRRKTGAEGAIPRQRIEEVLGCALR